MDGRTDKNRRTIAVLPSTNALRYGLANNCSYKNYYDCVLSLTGHEINVV